MIISFFEEFPTKNNLRRLKEVNFPTKLYLAAKSIKEFQKVRKSLPKNKFLKEVVYWPILKQKEGYWISPFSERKALLRIFTELNEAKHKWSVMLDLELPTRPNIWLYITQFWNFYRNKKLITDFIKNYPGQIYLAEYYPEGKKKEIILKSLGLHYTCKNRFNSIKIIKMCYHSFHTFPRGFFLKELQRGKKEYRDNFLVALGITATGIYGGKTLSTEQLKEDVLIAKKTGLKEVIIYRLGGGNFYSRKF
ncbi:hypothetical protein HYX12_04370 [Candidatus Woesearchaeota archaeon]|nr:hypothetical protein [Candidatus Woesearchaeota archaeon]